MCMNGMWYAHICGMFCHVVACALHMKDMGMGRGKVCQGHDCCHVVVSVPERSEVLDPFVSVWDGICANRPVLCSLAPFKCSLYYVLSYIL